MSLKVANKAEKKKEKINPKKVLAKKREREKNLADTLEEDLEKHGVRFFSPSEEVDGGLNINTDYLSLPSDITEVPSQELGKYMNAFTQQRMYMRTLVGWQEMKIEEKKRMYYDASHEKYEQLTFQKKLSETAKDKVLNNHEDIKPLFLEYKDAKKRLRLLELNIESIDDAIFNLSREISRREGDIDKERRNYTVQKS